MKRLLVAGASGAVGFEVLRQARDAGYVVRGLARNPRHRARLTRVTDDVRLLDACDPAQLKGVCGGVEVVISALGASVSPSAKERRSYFAVDTMANRYLLAEAKREGVRRFVYVSAHLEPGYAQTSYIRAHEKFVSELSSSGMPFSVIRPTGIYSALDELLMGSRRAPLPLMRGGSALTNPVHPGDVAGTCLSCVDQGPREISCGGPDTLTRRRIAEMLFEAWGRRSWLVPVAPEFLVLGGRMARLINPRLAELLEFAAAVSVTNCVAPARGTRRLEDYLADQVSRWREINRSGPRD